MQQSRYAGAGDKRHERDLPTLGCGVAPSFEGRLWTRACSRPHVSCSCPTQLQHYLDSGVVLGLRPSWLPVPSGNMVIGNISHWRGCGR